MANKADDCICWREFIAGSEAAFRTLYDGYVNRLFTYGCNFCQDEETVKDAIHDLFVDLYRYRPNLDPDVNLPAYLHSSFRRKLFITLKKDRQQGSDAYQDGDTADFGIDWDIESCIIRNEHESELTRLLTKEIRKLSGRQQEALYLRFTLDMSYEEVAGIMEVSPATCRTLVYRAVKQLRINMEHSKVPVLNLLILAFSSRF